MRIVFNSRHPESPATIFYVAGVKGIPEIKLNFFENYENFDVALFMGFGRDLQEAKLARAQNKKLKIGLLDPRDYLPEDVVSVVDFLIVDSFEMSDFFARYGKPIFRYVEYLEVPRLNRNHERKEKLIIGYHGNKIHLMAMHPKITAALDALAQKHEIEFWAIYNIKNVGIWNLGLPKVARVKHIQWSEEVLTELLPQIDIGIVPALLPFHAEKRVGRSRWPFTKVFNHAAGDYCWRFKMPTNFGRGIVFAMSGVPLVSDPFPSAFEYIRSGENGFIAYSSEAWFVALEQLIKKHELRNTFAKKLGEEVTERVDYQKQNKDLLYFLTNLETFSVSVQNLNAGDDYGWFSVAKYRIARFCTEIFNRVNRR